MPNRFRVWGAALLAVVLTLGLAGAFSPAVAGPGGSIAGRVLEAGGAAVVGAEVELDLHDSDDDSWSYVDTSEPITTNALGNYAFTGLAAGTYRVRVISPDHIRAYHPGVRDWWDATSVVVGAAEARTGIDVALVRGASISGRVRVPAGFDAGEVRVTAYIWDEDQNRWHPDESVWAGGDGTYRLFGLPEGQYRVGFEEWHDNLIPVHYPDAEEVDDATTVTTTVAAPATGINATLVEGHSITGVVTVPIGMDPSEVYVMAYRKTAEGDLIPGNSDAVTPSRDYLTSGQGTYAVNGLRAGNYIVKFVDYAGVLLNQYYPGVAESDDARVLAVPGAGALPPTPPSIDAVMVKGGSISGQLTVPSGLDAGDVYVWSYRLVDGDWVGSESGWVERGPVAATVGTFRLGSLEPGQYRLKFSDNSGLTAVEYYDGALSLDEAQSIHVAAGADVTGKDVTLELGAQISGQVTVPAAADPSEVRVRAYAWRGGAWEAMAYTYADDDGVYEVEGLRPGTYRIGFDHWYDEVVPEFFDDAAAIENATSLTVVAGENRSGINASLAEAPGDGGGPSVPPTGPPVVTPTVPPVVTPTEPPVVTPTVPPTTAPLPVIPLPIPVLPTPAPPAGGAGSGAVTPPLKSIARKKAPQVAGKVRVGKKLSASRGTWGAKSVKVKFQWFTKKGAKAVKVTKATKSSLKLTKKFKRKQVRVRVTVSKPGHRTVVFTSMWTKKVA